MDLDDDALYRALQTRDARFDGQLFIGVKTTGVYCRPICPARTPKLQNIRFFSAAAAAQEAGFRPCLRCRPETSPDLGAWRGASNTVQRALRLIEAGALDDADVEALATRLGMGERQLRRLFRQHLGASPVAVAQTRRVLLAKQLIQETRLPMVEVALASGFSSVRRFNETFQQLYNRPPLALRRSSTVEQAGAGGVTLNLAYRPPYDWAAMLDFLRLRAIPGVEAVEDGVYSRVIALAGAQGLLTVQAAVDARLSVTVRFPKLASLPAIIARVRRVFDLAADPQRIAAHLSQDPVLQPLVTARPGLRVPSAWDGFELGVRAILGQQISVRAAAVLAGRLACAYGARLGEPVPGFLGLTHAFPTPQALAVADLSSLPMPRARSAALSGLAGAAAADPELFAPRAGLEEAVAKLRRLPGVGEWTAQYIAMRQLREPDAFPAADLGLLRAMAAPGGERPTAAILLARAEQWRPWRAYAAQHLWTSHAAPRKPSKEKIHADCNAA